MLGLGSSVRESLLNSHQQLVPQRFVYKSAIKNNVKTGYLSFYLVHITENIREHKEAL